MIHVMIVRIFVALINLINVTRGCDHDGASGGGEMTG